MEWYIEWNDIEKMQSILEKSRSLEWEQQKAFYVYLKKRQGLVFGSRLGRCFPEEFERIILGRSKNEMGALQADVYSMYNVLKRGTEWDEDI